MDELQQYLARPRRRLKFAVTTRDANKPARWARLQFEVVFPLHAVVVVDGRSYESGLSNLWETHLGLVIDGSELVDVEDRMAGAGWTTPFHHSGRSSKHYSFQRPLPPDDTPATLAAIARDAAAAVLGTDDYDLTIEPYQGISADYIGEAAGYRFLSTTAGFIVTAPIVTILVALRTHSPLMVALVAGALVAVAALYLLLQPGRDVPPWRSALEPDIVLLRLEIAVGESALVQVPIVGPLVERAVSLAAVLLGVWVPVVVAIVIGRMTR